MNNLPPNKPKGSKKQRKVDGLLLSGEDRCSQYLMHIVVFGLALEAMQELRGHAKCTIKVNMLNVG